MTRDEERLQEAVSARLLDEADAHERAAWAWVDATLTPKQRCVGRFRSCGAIVEAERPIPNWLD